MSHKLGVLYLRRQHVSARLAKTLQKISHGLDDGVAFRFPLGELGSSLLNGVQIGSGAIPASSSVFSFVPYALMTYTGEFQLLTPQSRVLLEKLRRPQLVKKFSAFYGTRRFITTITSARHQSLYSATSI
jgi:hypothetical protein